MDIKNIDGDFFKELEALLKTVDIELMSLEHDELTLEHTGATRELKLEVRQAGNYRKK